MNLPSAHHIAQYLLPATWVASAGEVALALGIMLCIAAGLIRPKSAWLPVLIAASILAFNLEFLAEWCSCMGTAIVPKLYYRTDAIRMVLMLISVAGMLNLLLWLRHYSSGKIDSKQYFSEKIALLLTMILGLQWLAGANHFGVLFLGLELASMAAWGLTAFSLSQNSAEASLKYMILGAVASATMLFGISYVFGLTGTLSIDQLLIPSTAAKLQNPLGYVSVILFSGGLLYKLGALPWHFWAGDVYRSAPVPAAAIMAVAPKASAIMALAPFIELSRQLPQIQNLFTLLALGTVTLGNLLALGAKYPRQMMGWSSVAHAGFLMVGLVSGQESGRMAIMVYLVFMTLSNFGTFLVFSLMKADARFEDWAGMGKRMPIIAIVLSVFMLSLTGLPPTGGFTAKLLIFSSLWQRCSIYNQGIDYLLFAGGLMNTALSLVYYLRLPYFMFFREPQPGKEAELNPWQPWVTVLIVMHAIGIMWLFFNPNFFIL